ncbi:DUF2478 domain-containing protein [Silicimonas algicola]|uniref:Uncharacterized protein DUF2478 n=1 Tax=Silicimonas algicola TaxID=1826607 RepID=A0A316G7X2_9RHOB|nr:DUF2478 domain-containing protein [Silicimonas algicola]AZQ67368.1 DUF2478 domain-containing protein [Silicimonas algicola]PWK57051.1 uncharacterized protein DUF2478 [Silicimonas algicola]
MHIAYTVAPGRGATDLLLAGLVRRMAARGFRAAGTVQMNVIPDPDGPCDMDVNVLPDGPVIRISQSLGPDATGCRLDPGALEEAVRLTLGRLEGAEFLIVNKFGKHEAGGRGFRPVIAEALDLGLPVLVGLNRGNAEPFLSFTGGVAEELAPDEGVLADWLEARIGRTAAA